MVASTAQSSSSKPTNFGLAKYAVTQDHSLGRKFSEPSCQTRTEYQRDRDRIVHSTAFRRLEYKTQVFINHEGDLYRTRLTHSIEVAQIARSISRALHLNEDLTEAIALAHDLGHTAFGHAGQDALHECMKEYGGFEHNLQSLRVVDFLEEKYPDFDGLNLMFETREGILKHCSVKNARNMGMIGQRFIDRTQPSLEAQLTNIADEIAYNNHDVDDGLRSGLITIQQLQQVELFNRHYFEVNTRFTDLSDKRKAQETIRRIINQLVCDLIEHTLKNIEHNNIVSIQDVRSSKGAIVTFSPKLKKQMGELKSFLHANLYQHEQVNKMSANAKKVISNLFTNFYSNPELLPDEHRSKALARKKIGGNNEFARVIADYIAGMTDRYAEIEYSRIN
ncbi:MAG: deoxyguanosinetriphosphate triphosphohydrolase [Gammaproteobacteria bacterium]